MEFESSINLYLEYCMSKQLRKRSIDAYEQSIKLFAVWLKEKQGITEIEDVKDSTIRRYILDMQNRGKYTAGVNSAARRINFPELRTDYEGQISSITNNGYLRNLKGFFAG